MLVLLAAFAIVPLLLPWLVSKLGARAFYVSALLPVIAFVSTAVATPAVLDGDIPFEEYNWIPPLGISLSMRMDTLGWLMALVVTGVGALVMLYCRWYFRGKTEGLGQFSAVLLAFAGAMYGLVLTNDLVVLVMFWEVTSILSYLLIGYYHRRGASRRAALQALLVTTLGGLVMLIGVVLLVVDTGTSNISEILALAPTGPIVDAALVMLLVGALSKSAIFPFHFWLPGAMAAPTPVSAYLHAAAMVKAGIYLIARLAPVFAFAPSWRPIVIGLGIFTMLLGGLQALRETDLKRILAFGTVSQLGFLTVVLGYGTHEAALAGLALLLGHALFKSCLFLVVGVIDRQLSTRDIRELSGVARQAPVLTIVSTIAIASMAGIIPTLGFVAKESAITAFVEEALHGETWGLVALIGVSLGSVLTAAYGARFLWGAFGTKKDADGRALERTEWPDPPIGSSPRPSWLSTLTLAGGFGAPLLNTVLQPTRRPRPERAPGCPNPRARRTSRSGTGWNRPSSSRSPPSSSGSPSSGSPAGRPPPRPAACCRSPRSTSTTRCCVSSPAPRSSPRASPSAGLSGLRRHDLPRLRRGRSHRPALEPDVAGPPRRVADAVAARRRPRDDRRRCARREQPASATAAWCWSRSPARHGRAVRHERRARPRADPDPRRDRDAHRLRAGAAPHPGAHGRPQRLGVAVRRAVLAVGVGATMAMVAIVATGARQLRPISDSFPMLAYEIGHGRNVVNVALVDLRGWDTMGELSVLVLAATGVASLVFVTHRSDTLSKLTTRLPRLHKRGRGALVETTDGVRARTDDTSNSPQAWLFAGQRVRPENRSIILEVVVRVLFHTIIVVSLYLLFAGHNLPGGGFAGGLVAGMALVMRYIAGGRYELGPRRPPTPAACSASEWCWPSAARSCRCCSARLR